LLDHPAYVAMMQMLDRYGDGMNVPTWRLDATLIRAPEYSLGDTIRWLDGASRGSGPMWPDYRARDLIADVPAMPVPMPLISGERDINMPAELATEWFDGVEAPEGKRHVIFETSGHAPFLTERERFPQAVRNSAASLRSE
jgi:pimeloyl-ACP methyl ester carboxylesterase